MSGRRYLGVGALAVTSLVLASACGDDETGKTTSSSSSAGQGGSGQSSSSSSGMGGAGGAQCGGSMSMADCTSYCMGVVAAACPGGPTQQVCEQGCNMLNGNLAQCPAWGAVVDCAETAPNFTCFMGETVPEGCETEFYCLSQCLN